LFIRRSRQNAKAKIGVPEIMIGRKDRAERDVFPSCQPGHLLERRLNEISVGFHRLQQAAPVAVAHMERRLTKRAQGDACSRVDRDGCRSDGGRARSAGRRGCCAEFGKRRFDFQGGIKVTGLGRASEKLLH
jgi:hypothetical protein